MNEKLDKLLALRQAAQETVEKATVVLDESTMKEPGIWRVEYDDMVYLRDAVYRLKHALSTAAASERLAEDISPAIR